MIESDKKLELTSGAWMLINVSEFRAAQWHYLVFFLTDTSFFALWQTRVELFEEVAKAFCSQVAGELAIVLRDYRNKMGDLMCVKFTYISALIKDWLELKKQGAAPRHNLRDVLHHFLQHDMPQRCTSRIYGEHMSEALRRRRTGQG